jgi:nucleoside-diphosphate-sugar epimerase
MIGSGETIQHLTYVDDVVEGLLLCAECPQAVGQAYIIAGPRYTTLNDLVRATALAVGRQPPRGRIPLPAVMAAARLIETVCNWVGVEPPLHTRRVAFFTRSRGFSSHKAQLELGYLPHVDLEEGLARTAAWYQSSGLLNA